MRPLATAWLLVSFSFNTGIAQSTAQNQGPMEISDLSVAPSDRGLVAMLNLTNKSERGVSAHVLAADFFDSQGALSSRAVQVAMVGRQSPGSESNPPGHVTTARFMIPSKDGQPVNHRIYVDYVVFEDGSTWGPDQTHNPLKIEGIREGWRMASSHFKRVLHDGGQQGLAEALAK